MNGGVVCVGLGTNLHLNVRRNMLGIVTAARDQAAPGTRVIWTACSGEQTYNWGPHGGAFVDTLQRMLASTGNLAIY